MNRERSIFKVFLCYSFNDRKKVRNIYQRLLSDGIKTWFKEESLLAGQNKKKQTEKALRHCDVVIVCISETAINNKGGFQKEIKLALELADEQPEDSIFIIPVKLEDCNIPEYLSHLHEVKYYEDRGYDNLLHSLTLYTQANNIMKNQISEIKEKRFRFNFFKQSFLDTSDKLQFVNKYWGINADDSIPEKPGFDIDSDIRNSRRWKITTLSSGSYFLREILRKSIAIPLVQQIKHELISFIYEYNVGINYDGNDNINSLNLNIERPWSLVENTGKLETLLSIDEGQVYELYKYREGFDLTKDSKINWEDIIEIVIGLQKLSKILFNQSEANFDFINRLKNRFKNNILHQYEPYKQYFYKWNKIYNNIAESSISEKKKGKIWRYFTSAKKYFEQTVNDDFIAELDVGGANDELYLIHGDMTIANLYKADDKIFLFDWDVARVQRNPFFDLCYILTRCSVGPYGREINPNISEYELKQIKEILNLYQEKVKSINTNGNKKFNNLPICTTSLLIKGLKTVKIEYALRMIEYLLIKFMDKSNRTPEISLDYLSRLSLNRVDNIIQRFQDYPINEQL